MRLSSSSMSTVGTSVLGRFSPPQARLTNSTLSRTCPIPPIAILPMSNALEVLVAIVVSCEGCSDER